MKCLSDILCGNYALIGVKDFVNCPHPETILYVNDIPGITLKSAAAIANDEQRSGINLLKDKINLATKKVFNKFSGIVSGNFDFNAIIESREINKFTTDIKPKAALNRGLVLNRWSSEMARIYIENVYIKTAQSGIAIITIKDGELVKNYSVSLLANVTNEISIRYQCNAEEVYITFDQTNFDVYSCNIGSSTVGGCGTCSSKRANHKKHDLIINGWNGTAEENSCFGMGVLANVQCYEEAIICQLLPRMAFMMWYQSGIEILQEHISSGRINAVVTFTKDQAKENLIYLQEQLIEEEKQFNNNIKNFIKTTKGDCFACNGIKSGYVLP